MDTTVAMETTTELACIVAVVILIWIGMKLMKEAFLMITMAGIVVVWFGWLAECKDVLLEERGVFLVGTGGAAFLVGAAYKSLPVTLIPDWVPIIGKLDNEFAGTLQFLGIICAAIGFYIERDPNHVHMEVPLPGGFKVKF